MFRQLQLGNYDKDSIFHVKYREWVVTQDCIITFIPNPPKKIFHSDSMRLFIWYISVKIIQTHVEEN